MKVLYITYVDIFEKAKSGSSVRPQKMYKAMLNEGHDVVLLQTQQNKRSLRHKVVRDMMRKVKEDNFDICYIESPSGPIFNNIDIKLIKLIHSKNIPIGFFYRDAYWLFANSWLHVNKLKKYIIEKLHKRDIKVFQNCVSTFYMPSILACEGLLKHYHFDDIKELPPGTECITIQEYNTTKTAIYVGGCSYQYGTDILIKAYKELNENGYKYNLIIITRKNEWDNMYPDGLTYEWLQVMHKSGDELREIYQNADCAILPVRKSYYSDIAYSIKLFEYLSYGKPIITSNLATMGEFVQKNGCGIVYDSTEKGLQKSIINFYDNEQIRREIYENVIKTCHENTWESRVQKIIEDLIV